jgi:hypothetical protein
MKDRVAAANLDLAPLHAQSIGCQQKHYAKSDEWKKKRQLYMRDYRAMTKGRLIRSARY